MSHKASNEWWDQRLTAVMMVFTSLLCLGAVAFSIKNIRPLELFFKAIISPFWAVFFIMISVAVFYHGAIGMKIILEDYVHSIILRKIMINCVFLLSFFMIGIFSLTVITLNIKYAILH